jgi:hypothetical protein
VSFSHLRKIDTNAVERTHPCVSITNHWVTDYCNIGRNDIYNYPLTGRVGIGTPYPQERVQIDDVFSFRNDGGFILGYNYFYNGTAAAKLKSGYSSALRFQSDGSITFKTGDNGSAGTAIGNWTDKLTISNNGNVGIGTIATHKLDVCGTIQSKEVIVTDNSWCDFVFEETYTRMSLSEREIFLKKYKHLPNIKPAKEIESNGLELKETLKGLTQNVEEMSLDMIEIYKMFLEVKKENAELKAEMKKHKRTK